MVLAPVGDATEGGERESGVCWGGIVVCDEAGSVARCCGGGEEMLSREKTGQSVLRELRPSTAPGSATSTWSTTAGATAESSTVAKPSSLS